MILFLEKKYIMKALILTAIISIFVITSLKSQSDESVFLTWDLKHSAITDIDEKLSDALVIEAGLAFVIPTGKRRLSYILKFDVDEAYFEKLGSYFLDIEVWADTDGDKLLDFLSCNTELPYMFIDDETMLKYNHPKVQPCLGTELVLYLSVIEQNGINNYHLLKLEKR